MAQLVGHLLWEQDAASSSLATPTKRPAENGHKIPVSGQFLYNSDKGLFDFIIQTIVCTFLSEKSDQIQLYY